MSNIHDQNLIKPHERLDDLELAGLYSIQNPESFRYGLDSVLLAYFAGAKNAKSVLDLGTGSGILPLLLYGRYQTKRIVGVEIQPDMADMAKRSVAYNGLSEHIEIIKGDYRDDELIHGLGVFDLVISNPPYLKMEDGQPSQELGEAIARHELTAKLTDTVHAASLALQQGGRLCMVHLPRRADELCLAMNLENITPKRMRLVQPNAQRAPNIMLIEGIKHGKRGVEWEPTLMVNDSGGGYSEQMQKIYGRED